MKKATEQKKAEKKEMVSRRKKEYAARAAIALPTDSDPIRAVRFSCALSC